MRPALVAPVCLVVACVACVACAPAPRPQQAPPPGVPHVTVLTFNVNFGLPGEPGVIDVIRRAGADLVLLQETNPAWEAELRGALASVYPRMEFHHEPAAGGLAVLARRPFVVEEYLAAPSGWFPAARLVAETPLGPLQVLNVHLRPPLSASEGYVSGYLRSREVRRVEIAAYHARLDPRLPTLVAGDFNEDADGRAVRYLRARGLRSVLPEYQPRARTWRWHTSLGTITQRLDHLVCDGRLEPLAARVLPGGESDHLAVTATFVAAR